MTKPYRYTEKEVAIIKANTHLTRHALAKLLPGRTPKSVAYKARQLGYQLPPRPLPKRADSYTEAEDDFIRQHAGRPGWTSEAIGKMLGRTRDSVRQRVYRYLPNISLRPQTRRITVTVPDGVTAEAVERAAKELVE